VTTGVRERRGRMTMSDPYPGFDADPGWERQVGRTAVERVLRRLQPVLDEIHDQYAGRPVDEIKPVLAREWTACTDGGPIADPDLTRYASVISQGRRIVLDMET
jgi:hypothetical protein